MCLRAPDLLRQARMHRARRLAAAAAGLLFAYGCATVEETPPDRTFGVRDGGSGEPSPTGRPSCDGRTGADDRCGGSPDDEDAPGAQDCCEVRAVPGGSFNRFGDPAYPATVSSFGLDTFLLTAGRFRTYVDATNGNIRANAPRDGAGAHPRIAGSGWRSEWNQFLPSSRAEVDLMLGPDEGNGQFMGCQVGTDIDQYGALTWWTPALDARIKERNPNNLVVLRENTREALDRKPLNCIPWYVLFAFCIWDGGRLPTEAEFAYAASGGAEQRPFPWGGVPPDGIAVVGGRDWFAPEPTFAWGHAHLNARLWDTRIGDGSNRYEDNYGFTWGGNLMAPSDNASHVAPVGRKPRGNGKWGHADLAGGMFEWMLDEGPVRPGTCNDCANIAWPPPDQRDPNAYMTQIDFQAPTGDWFLGGARVVRGGAWDNAAAISNVQGAREIRYFTSYPVRRTYRALGGRCAR